MLDSYGKAHPMVVVRFLTAMMLADRWMNTPANNDALVALGIKETGEDPAAVAYAVNFLRSSGPGRRDRAVPDRSDYTAGILFKYKDISTLPTYSQIVDDSNAGKGRWRDSAHDGRHSPRSDSAGGRGYCPRLRRQRRRASCARAIPATPSGRRPSRRTSAVTPWGRCLSCWPGTTSTASSSPRRTTSMPR